MQGVKHMAEIPGSQVFDSLYPVAVDGVGMCFYAPSDDDVIQAFHRRGRLYEEVELRLIASHLGHGAVVLDIGANVGNHTVFFARSCRASQVVVFEPNPAAITVLNANIRINRIGDVVDSRFLGIGVGAGSGSADLLETTGNLGVTRLIGRSDGPVGIKALDELHLDVRPTFIKIDVEGMEMDVLAGGMKLIEELKPSMYVEVHETNYERFAAFVVERRYQVVASYSRYPYNRNFLITSTSS